MKGGEARVLGLVQCRGMPSAWLRVVVEDVERGLGVLEITSRTRRVAVSQDSLKSLGIFANSAFAHSYPAHIVGKMVLKCETVLGLEGQRKQLDSRGPRLRECGVLRDASLPAEVPGRGDG